MTVSIKSTVFYFFADHPAQFKIGDEIIDAERTEVSAVSAEEMAITRGEFRS